MQVLLLIIKYINKFLLAVFKNYKIAIFVAQLKYYNDFKWNFS